jgi:hypothetical protein
VRRGKENKNFSGCVNIRLDLATVTGSALPRKVGERAVTGSLVLAVLLKNMSANLFLIGVENST